MLIAMRMTGVALPIVTMALALTSGAVEPDYRFDGKISREVLENYLSRAVTFTDFLHGKGSVTDTRSAATPEVFNQEETIKAVWTEGTSEQPIGKSVPGLAGSEDGEASLFSRSLVSTGHLARLEGILAKARRGEPLTIGVIGGSITAGAAASQPEKRYGDRVAAWWRSVFPKANVRFVNAGIGATGSDYGALRAKRDLLSHHPDFIIVEYAVNDPNTQAAAETLEGLVRQVLRETNQPAVLLLFTMHQDGGNAQEWQAKVGRHYDLPMVSFRDALWPEIKEGRMKWADVEADAVHPNDRGHDYCGRFITRLLDRVLAALPADEHLPQISPVPQPLISDQFEHVALFEADALKPLTNQGWTCETGQPGDKYWKADQPGSVIEFEASGQTILLMDWHIRGPMGQASVRVDEQPSVLREGWFEQTWGGYRQTTLLARELGPGKHKVRIELLPEKNPQSTGHEFRVLGLGVAGVKAKN
jgi:lysophospholipase L1-like esterase